MPGELLGRTGVQRVETDITDAVIQTTKPAVIIGIGGTGKEVLLRLRQRFYEKYGQVGLPTVAYLWLDTDMGDYGIVQGKPLDYIQPEAHFKIGEYVDCQIEAAPFLEFFRNANKFGHIWSWLYPQLQAFGQVQSGAAQTPPLGRLAFFHKFPEIRSAFEDRSELVFGQSQLLRLQDDYGMSLDAGNLLVIIVASIAGGTGTGMLLDTAFLARHMFRDRSPEIVSYLLLPSAFGSAQEAPRIYANAYAKLKELEFYSLRREYLSADTKAAKSGPRTSVHDFTVDWTGTNYPGKAIAGPPFNNCYLIDNETAKGGRIDNKNLPDICDMIAESIFVDFAAQAFAARKRMVRVNLNEYLNAVVDYEYRDSKERTIHTDVFSCRFSSFGFSMVNVPLDRIRKVCGYQLSCDVVRYWLRENAVAGNLRSQIEEEVLGKLRLRAYRGQDDYFDGLSVSDESGTTFQKLIKDKWYEVRGALQAQVVGGAAQAGAYFADQFDDFKDRYFSEKVDDKEPRGEFIRRLRKTNVRVFLDGKKDPEGNVLDEGATKRIRQALAEWLEQEVVGLPAAIEHLAVVGEILAEQAETFQELADYYKDAAERTLAEVEGLKLIMTDEESGTVRQRASLRACGDTICQKADKHFAERISSLVYQEARKIALELREFVGSRTRVAEKDGTTKAVASGLILELWRLQEELEGMLTYFEGRRKSFDHADPHLIFQTLYESGMYKQYYHLHDAEGEDVEVVARDQKDKLYGKVGWRSLLGVLRDIDGSGATQVRDAVEGFCLDRFRGQRLEIDVVEKLYEMKPTVGDRRRVLENLVKSGTVWLRPSEKALAEPNILAPYVDDVVIGLHHTQHDRNLEVEKDLTSLVEGAKFRTSVGKPIDVGSHVVYLYSEFAGLPIPYASGIREYRDAYYMEIRGGHQKGRHCPHISRQNVWFPDVVVEDQYHIDRLIKVNEILFIGAMLRVFKLSETPEGSVHYSFEDQTGLSYDRILGDRNQAMAALLSDDALLEELEGRVDSARAELALGRRQELNVVLSYHTAQEGKFKGVPAGPYPPEHIFVGDMTRENFTPEYRAINAVLLEEQQKLMDQMRVKKDALEKLFVDRYAELDDFSEKVCINGKDHRILREV